ncbi:MAG: hypothetical protein NZ552_00345 [Planctomycetes bacterium]|nr:hypothetical protein [Planctomycetota bacterium]
MPGLPVECPHDPHVHLYGALQPSELLQLAVGRAIDWGPVAEVWHEARTTPPDFSALVAMARRDPETAGRRLAEALARLPAGTASLRARFALVHACTRWGSAAHAHWNSAVADEVEQVWSWVATRWPVEARIQLPADASERWAACALEHVAACAAKHGMTVIISLPRAAPLKHWPLVAESAHRHPTIVGVDLCGIEDEPARHAPLSAALAAWNHRFAPRRLQFAVHVGEQLDCMTPLTAIRRVWDAIAIGADRLGHALAIRLDPAAWPAGPAWQTVAERSADLQWLQWQADILELDGDAIDAELSELRVRDPHSQVGVVPADHGLVSACQETVRARLRATQRLVECCPTSNEQISGAPLARHGLKSLTGIPWVVGSDDPGLLGVTWPEECARALAVIAR